MSIARRGPRVANRKAHARKSKLEKKAKESKELEEICQRVAGYVVAEDSIKSFSELPISSRTKQGLEAAHFVTLTDIQKASIPPALAGNDVLGAARTGSGKTLAFLIPLLEKLYRENWSPMDGLGALVLSPTRELALQTFEVLRRIGKYHTLSAGLIIGGKDLKAERDAISRMNILIATPGRLLQHLDQTRGFDWSQLQLLVLDEADRILDLGFSRTVDAILEALPRDRQTLLFSATQTDSVEALARLSLRKGAATIAVGASAGDQTAYVTPEQLEQSYLLCPLQEKYDRLYSFIKGHLKSKIIVFFSSCKQVRFTFEAFCRLQPGVPLLHLHGRQKQPKRSSIFSDFCRKSSAVLFATDVAARGLDFPAVDWVVQADCPEDVETYIHRVGRTARLNKAGKAVLFLLPSEATMLELLSARGIPIKPVYPKIAKDHPLPPPKRPIKAQLQALCSQDPEVKYLAQKALVSYVRSVFLHGNKDVFKVQELPVDEFAASLGLAGTPKLRFASKCLAKNASRDTQRAVAEVSSDSEREDTVAAAKPTAEKASEAEEKKKSVPQRRIDKMFKRKNIDVYSEHYRKLRDDETDQEDGRATPGITDKLAGGSDDELLTVKRRDHEIEPDQMDIPKTVPLKVSRRDALKTKKKYILKNAPRFTHIVFDEEEKAHPVLPFTPECQFDRSQAEQAAESFATQERGHMEQIDKEDAARVRLARRTLRIEKKRREKEISRNAHAAKAPRLEG